MIKSITMGAGETKPIELPAVCNIKREKFQDRLMDIYAVYSLMKHYNDLIQVADINENGRPPKTLDVAQNFDEKTVQRIRKRAAGAGGEGPDYELYSYFGTFAKMYNQVEGDRARLELLHGAVTKCYAVLVAFTDNLSDLCDAKMEFIEEKNSGDYVRILQEQEPKPKNV
jgi:hypothetical protein